MKLINKVLLAAIVVVCMFSAKIGNAQTHYTSNAIGIQFGTAVPYTDIRSHQYYHSFKTGDQSEYKPFIGGNVLHMFSHIIGIYADADYAKLEGIMANRNISTTTKYSSEDYALYQRLGFSRQIYFKTNLIDASVNLYVNISNMGWFTKMANNKNAKMRRLGLYAYAGVGMITYNPLVHALLPSEQSIIDKESFYLHGYATKKTGLFHVTDLVFPTAIGLKYHLSKSVDLGIEASVRFVASDKLDGVDDQIAMTYGKAFQATPVVTGTSTLSTSRYQGYAYDKYAYMGFKVMYKLNCCKAGNLNIEWNDPQEAILKNVDAEMNKLRALLNDSDKDGVSDAFDKEPNTPANVKVDGAGQALDVDGDGVADYKDDEPFSPKGATVNESGIAADADNDGVADVKDLEPNSKPNALVNFRGITIGARDAAPTASSTKEDKPLFMFPSVYFDVNSAQIRPQYFDVLSDAARNLIKDPNMKINIFGNCDVRGSEELNNQLGRQRAEAVANYLRKNYKIEAGRIKIVDSFGKSHPISDQHRPNRRVDILLAE